MARSRPRTVPSGIAKTANIAALALLVGVALVACAGARRGGTALAGSYSAHALLIEADPSGGMSYVQGRARAAAGGPAISASLR
jgi:hypothetical protein